MTPAGMPNNNFSSPLSRLPPRLTIGYKDPEIAGMKASLEDFFFGVKLPSIQSLISSGDYRTELVVHVQTLF